MGWSRGSSIFDDISKSIDEALGSISKLFD